MSQYGWENCPAAVKLQVEGFTNDLVKLLAGNLTGIYLHGSLAMGCFNPNRSDLDLLVITQQWLPAEMQPRLAELLLATSGAPQPIEISILPYSALIPWQFPTPFDFHYSEEWREQMQQALQAAKQEAEALEEKSSSASLSRRDPDLAAHVTITKHRGICLHGAPIAELFPDVPPADYLASILSDVEDAFGWFMDNPVYATLNTCRVYAFLRDGLICSKQEGGVWALTAVPEAGRPTVMAALAAYADDDQAVLFEPAAVAEFMSCMQQKLFPNSL